MSATILNQNLTDSRYDTLNNLLSEAKQAEQNGSLAAYGSLISALWTEIYRLGEQDEWSEGQLYAAIDNAATICVECDLLPAMPNSELCKRCGHIEKPAEIPTKKEKPNSYDRAIEKALVLQAEGRMPRVKRVLREAGLISAWVESTTQHGKAYFVTLREDGALEGASCLCDGRYHSSCVHRAVLFLAAQDWLAQEDEAGKVEAA